jgi:LPXTG-motif cell wall-anchored protein
MKNIKLFLFTAVLFSLTGFAHLFAHPGHGTTEGHSYIHYFTEPMHVMVLSAIIIMIASSATWFLLRKRKKNTVDA